jgi:hypothetical protein
MTAIGAGSHVTAIPGNFRGRARMLSRALSLATVTLLIGCCTAGLARAQENLDAGKSPSQIFAGTCTACHKSPRGLLKTVAPGSLPGFLRQHYTTSPEMAGVLSSYLVSNGATDTRMGGGQAKDGKGTKEGTKEAKSDARPEGRPEQLDRFGRRQRPAAPQEADAPADEPKPARPDGDIERPGRKRLARPADAPADAAKPEVDGLPPAQAAGERSDSHRSSPKQKLTKRTRPGIEEAPKEPPKGEAKEEPAAGAQPQSETAKVDADRPEPTKPDAIKPDTIKPSTEGPSQSTTVEPPRDTGSPGPRPDPVTPAPSANAAPAMSAAVSSGGSEPAAGSPPGTASAPPVTAAAPSPPAPAGPPVPPISQ